MNIHFHLRRSEVEDFALTGCASKRSVHEKERAFFKDSLLDFPVDEGYCHVACRVALGCEDEVIFIGKVD